MDILAHHLKHVQSYEEEIRPTSPPGVSIGFVLGFEEIAEELDVRNLYFVIRDAVRFVHKKAGTTHPRLP